MMWKLGGDANRGRLPHKLAYTIIKQNLEVSKLIYISIDRLPRTHKKIGVPFEGFH